MALQGDHNAAALKEAWHMRFYFSSIPHFESAICGARRREIADLLKYIVKRSEFYAVSSPPLKVY